MTWDDSRLPEGVLEVVKEFQDSDGFIFYEGTSSTGHASRYFLQDSKLFSAGLAQFLVDGGIGEAKD